MSKHLVVVIVSLCVTIGCGAEMTPSPRNEVTFESDEALTKSSVSNPETAAASVASKRRLIVKAEVDLVVEQFDPLPGKIEAAVKQHDGFISASNVAGLPGQPRVGRWTVRVPVDRYPEFMTTVRMLGEVQSLNSTSDDVTASYVDIEARIRNQQREEERMLTLLSEATGKLEEVLAVEKELARVRGEIEQSQGRLRMLSDLTDLSTVVVRVAEIKNYLPNDSPSYVMRARRAFVSSTDAFVRTLQTLSLIAIAGVPWLILPLSLAILLMLIRWLRRRQRRRTVPQ